MNIGNYKITFKPTSTVSFDRLVECPKIEFQTRAGHEFAICFLSDRTVRPEDMTKLGNIFFKALKHEQSNRYLVVIEEIKKAVEKSLLNRRTTAHKTRSGRVPVTRVGRGKMNHR